MIRRILWLAPIALMAGSAFLGWELTDYRQGYRQASEDVEKFKDEYGWMAEAGRSAWDVAGDLPLDQLPLDRLPSQFQVDPDRSEKWQQGYREAVAEYLKRQRSRR